MYVCWTTSFGKVCFGCEKKLELGIETFKWESAKL